ncbi:MAG TPA: hypothetical protein VKU19_41890 [Bryobacteraceae bacterium]|nr:hypothetical protein [Bryobacteraceae bacterium]
MTCAICKTRRPRRFCPGVKGEICTVCCGQEREVTVTCPFDCQYLVESRKHDQPLVTSDGELSNPDIKVNRKTLEGTEDLWFFTGRLLLVASIATHGAVDSDVREALEALIRTYRTLQSGVLFESVPENALAATIFREVQKGLARFREEEAKHLGMPRTRDSHVLVILVMFHRLAVESNNGRPRGRAFLSELLKEHGVSQPSPPSPSSLILP